MKKFEEKLISTEKKRRDLIAIDETVVKANRKNYYVFSAVDVERNEINTHESLYNKKLPYR